MEIIWKLCVVIVWSNGVLSVPVDRHARTDSAPPPSQTAGSESNDVLDLEYRTYLDEVVNALQQDKNFFANYEKYGANNIEGLAEHLQDVDPQLRTRLDEAKRIEIERLRKKVNEMNHADRSSFQLPEHLDLSNHKQFNKKDFQQLVRTATKDIEALDAKREKTFKEHEMKKKFDHDREMQEIKDQEERRIAEENYAKKQRELRDRADKNIVHPASRKQMEEVWREQDRLTNEFNPVTFFRLHDLDGNDVLDENEVKNMLQGELDRAYGSDGDPVEREEEAERMMNHYLQEINRGDKNKGRVIRYKDFIDYVHSTRFEQDDEWDTVLDRQAFTDDEYQQYERLREGQINGMMNEGLTREQAEMVLNKQRQLNVNVQNEIANDVERLREYNEKMQQRDRQGAFAGQQQYAQGGPGQQQRVQAQQQYQQGAPVAQQQYPQGGPGQQQRVQAQQHYQQGAPAAQQQYAQGGPGQQQRVPAQQQYQQGAPVAEQQYPQGGPGQQHYQQGVPTGQQQRVQAQQQYAQPQQQYQQAPVSQQPPSGQVYNRV